MKIKFEVELDTDKVEDEEKLDEILTLLRDLRELIEVKKHD